MNEELLNTPVVKGTISYYIKIGLSFEEIKERLENIHLIIVGDEALKKFIDTIKQGEKSK